MANPPQDWSPAEVDNVKGIRWSSSKMALFCRTVVAGGAVLNFSVPCSLIDENSEVYKPGTEGTLIIPTWLASQKGVI